MFYKKRGQAAMEFLMTYGWAILVVLVAIAALAYFGVLSPARFLPERCFLAPGVACLDHSISTSGLSLVLRNSLGSDISGVTVAACGGTSASTALANGAQATVSITCSPALSSGSQFKGTLNLTYTNVDTGLTHSVNGDLAARVA